MRARSEVSQTSRGKTQVWYKSAERFASTRSLTCAIRASMLSRIMISVVTTVTLMAAPLGSAARSCILVNAPSQKACQPRCCANMTCCATSAKNTAPSSQPLAKSGSASTTNAISAPTGFAVLPNQLWQDRLVGRTDLVLAALSPPRLSLLCTFLI
jgi:hypothetical protein